VAVCSSLRVLKIECTQIESRANKRSIINLIGHNVKIHLSNIIKFTGCNQRVLRSFPENLPEHPSDTKVFTMKMEILLEPTSNKLLVASFQQSQIHMFKAFNVKSLYGEIASPKKSHVKLEGQIKGGSHETFQCQPMTQNIDFFDKDQIQTPQYPDVHPPSQETSDEVFQANHSIQNKESLENSYKEIAISNSNQEKEELPQDSDIHQLIEECSTEASEEQKQSMEDTMLELVKIYQEKEFLCIHDDVADLNESVLNSKLLLINSNSQRLQKEQQEVKNVVEQPVERGNRSIQSLQNFRVVHKSSISFRDTSQISSSHAVAPILSTKEPEHLLSMVYEHLSITPETESDEVTKSNDKNLLPIPSECEVTLEDESKRDVPISKNSPICDDHYDIFSDFKIDDDISVYDDGFEDIEYIEASLFDPEIVSGVSIRRGRDNFSPEFETFCDYMDEMRSGNTTHVDNSLIEYDSFCFEIEPDQERLINLVKNDISDNSPNDPLLEEADLFLAYDNWIPPGIENVADDSKGDIRFLEELLINDSILSHESSDSNFEDNLSIPRPPPEPPDAETDTGEEIPVVMNDKDKFDEDYYFFMIDNVFSFLSAESEDTIFDPASLSDPEIVSLAEENGVEEENVVQQKEEEVDLEDISQIQDVVLREKLLSITRLISNIKSLNDNSTPNHVLNSFHNSPSDNFSPKFKTFCDHSEETRSGNTTQADNSLLEYDSFYFEIEPDQERLINLVKSSIPDDSSNDSLLEEADLFLASDNSIPPGIENVADDPEGDIRFLEELLIDDSILSDSNFKDNPSIPRPPPEPPDAGEETPFVMSDKDENVDYSYFMFVIFDKVFSLLSAESEDTIFDPGISD
nr:hypothetical protein [Tanacetum cinerariifolium]